LKSPHPSFHLTEADTAYFHKIPKQFLTLVKLLHYEKMNYREIGQQTGLSPGTVSSRIFRARRMIDRMRAEDAAAAEVWQVPTMPTAEEIGTYTP